MRKSIVFILPILFIVLLVLKFTVINKKEKQQEEETVYLTFKHIQDELIQKEQNCSENFEVESILFTYKNNFGFREACLLNCDGSIEQLLKSDRLTNEDITHAEATLEGEEMMAYTNTYFKELVRHQYNKRKPRYYLKGVKIYFKIKGEASFQLPLNSQNVNSEPFKTFFEKCNVLIQDLHTDSINMHQQIPTYRKLKNE